MEEIPSYMKGPEGLDLSLDLRYLSTGGGNPLSAHNSSPRIQMNGSHRGQSLCVSGAGEPWIQTGFDNELAKYTFAKEMPCTAVILKIIDRYPRTMGSNVIAHNPEKLVIYEDVTTRQIGCIDLPVYCSKHQFFGFRYVRTPAYYALRPGLCVEKGTVLLQSPSVTAEGGYKSGIQMNLALVTINGTGDDGYIIADDVLQKATYNGYEEITVGWGGNKFPLNVHGTLDEYKIVPDIGELIPPNRILMAFREIKDPALAVIEQSRQATRRINYLSDQPIWATKTGGRVIDIKIHHDDVNTNPGMAVVNAQIDKYISAGRDFYRKLVDYDSELRRTGIPPDRVSEQLHQIITNARSNICDAPDGGRIHKLYRQAPLDHYSATITIEYTTKPGNGGKFADQAGGKGVVVAIWPRANMPVDANGNSADIIGDPMATVNRMNLGRLYEQAINAASRDVRLKICDMLNICVDTDKSLAIEHLKKQLGNLIDEAYEYVRGYLSTISYEMGDWFKNGAVTESKIDLLAHYVKYPIFIYFKPGALKYRPQIIRDIKSKYPPVRGPVSYIGADGTHHTTVDPVLIGSVYMLALEKMADTWSACASTRFQHFGIPAPLTRRDRNELPARQQPVKAWGESEYRILVSYTSQFVIAETIDRNNNPKTHKHCCELILSADRPTDIECLVDRRKIPFGGSKPLQVLKHYGDVSGYAFFYYKHNPNLPQGITRV